MRETYSLKLRCTNCDYHWHKEFPKGKPFNDSIVYCPNCGCSGTSVKDLSIDGPRWKEGWMDSRMGGGRIVMKARR